MLRHRREREEDPARIRARDRLRKRREYLANPELVRAKHRAWYRHSHGGRLWLRRNKNRIAAVQWQRLGEAAARLVAAKTKKKTKGKKR